MYNTYSCFTGRGRKIHIEKKKKRNNKMLSFVDTLLKWGVLSHTPRNFLSLFHCNTHALCHVSAHTLRTNTVLCHCSKMSLLTYTQTYAHISASTILMGGVAGVGGRGGLCMFTYRPSYSPTDLFTWVPLSPRSNKQAQGKR